MNDQKELQFQVECLQGVAVVNCAGRMVRGIALDELRRCVERLDHVRMLVIDLSDVEQVDAGGLGTLLLMRRWAMRSAAKMKLVNPPPFFRSMLEVTHLSSLFEVSSLKEAICILRTQERSQQFAIA
jgi:anti-anti-sigma factor